MKYLLISLSLLAAVWYMSRLELEQTELAGKLIRLHVVANSDGEYDQAYKLNVRDKVLEAVTPLLEGAANRGEAAARLTAELPELNAEFVRYDAAVTLATERFPERQYETFSLPAGEYLALRVTIGEGKGKNWWCVVFPALCTELVTDFESYGDNGYDNDNNNDNSNANQPAAEAFAMLTDDETSFIKGADEGGVKIKFRLLDFIAKFTGSVTDE